MDRSGVVVATFRNSEDGEAFRSELPQDAIRLLLGVHSVCSKDLGESACGYVCTCAF